jgi:GNAT superfamily N-acetyltransferase
LVVSVDLPAGVAADLELAVRPYADPQVQELVAAVQAEYVVRYGGPDEAAVDDGEFEPPRGLFLIGLAGGEPVAMGGWRRLDRADGEDADHAGVAEIKRMFVLDRGRRRGLARRILAELERTAAGAGVRRLVLNTGVHQPEAIALYESSGYRSVPDFGHYAGYPNALFYGKSL